MSSERSISPDPLPSAYPRSASHFVDDRDSNGHASRHSSAAYNKRRRDLLTRTPSPRPVISRSRSRSPIGGSPSPPPRRNVNSSSHRSPSPHRPSSSSSKRHRHRGSDADSGRHICAICSTDVEAAKRLYGVLDNCDHVFCYECIVSWKRSKYSNAESESCPVCKVRSAFITPSKHWFENKDDKYRIIKKHKNHLKTLPCRYYLRHGFCRYSDRCFYDHQEAAKQYKQQNQHSRDRDRDRDYGRERERERGRYSPQASGRSYRQSPSPGRYAPPSSSSRYRERPY